ncbi:MAG: calcium/sodium antiporter [Desulfobacterales bacterium]
MTTIWPYLLMLIGFALLIKGADIFVDGAVSVARRLNLPDIVIGLTVVAFGTSAPELFVNLIAGIRGDTDIAIGNVLGSNIANTLLILGIAAVIRPLSVTQGTVWREIPFSLLAAIVLGLMANDRLLDNRDFADISRSDGLVLLCFFMIFLYYAFTATGDSEAPAPAIPEHTYGLAGTALRLAGGLAGLVLGGRWIVGGAVAVADALGLSQAVIGLTVVAVGTSLPELATSAAAAHKGKVDIAVGNVVGSNIFNIFFVLGTTATIRPLPFHAGSNLDVLMTVFTGLLLFGFMFSGRKGRVDRWEGVIALLLYTAFIGYRIAGQ